MKSRLSPLAMLFAASVLSAPALAAPATGPDPLFHRQRPVQPRGRDRSADQPRRPHHRLCPQVERHHDRQGALDHLAGRRRNRPAAPARSPAPAPISRRAGRPTARRLAYVAAEGGNPQLYVRWMASGESARITGLPDSPGAIAWSPDGRRIAYTMFVPDDGPKLGKAPRQARRRQMGRPAPGDRRGHLPHRRRRLSEARLLPDLLGAVGRRRSDPADLRRDPRRRRRFVDAGRPLDPVQRQPVEELGARAAQQRSLSRQHRRRRARRADQPRRSRQFARSSRPTAATSPSSASTTASSATRTRGCRS